MNNKVKISILLIAMSGGVTVTSANYLLNQYESSDSNVELKSGDEYPHTIDSVTVTNITPISATVNYESTGNGERVSVWLRQPSGSHYANLASSTSEDGSMVVNNLTANTTYDDLYVTVQWWTEDIYGSQVIAEERRHDVPTFTTLPEPAGIELESYNINIDRNSVKIDYVTSGMVDSVELGYFEGLHTIIIIGESTNTAGSFTVNDLEWNTTYEWWINVIGHDVYGNEKELLVYLDPFTIGEEPTSPKILSYSVTVEQNSVKVGYTTSGTVDNVSLKNGSNTIMASSTEANGTLVVEDLEWETLYSGWYLTVMGNDSIDYQFIGDFVTE